MLTIGLLLISNIFMTVAWYGNLRLPHLPMIAAILIGWGIWMTLQKAVLLFK